MRYAGTVLMLLVLANAPARAAPVNLTCVKPSGFTTAIMFDWETQQVLINGSQTEQSVIDPFEIKFMSAGFFYEINRSSGTMMVQYPDKKHGELYHCTKAAPKF